jgi:ATP-binding protein involved in chromosome partitioning
VIVSICFSVSGFPAPTAGKGGYSVKMFERVSVPVLGIVENMSWFENPETGKPIAVFGSGGGERLSRETDVPLLGQVPLDPRIQEGGDTGRPIVIAEPTSKAAKVLSDIAGRVVDGLAARYGPAKPA